MSETTTNETTNRSIGAGAAALAIIGGVFVLIRMIGGRSPSEDRPGLGDNKVLDQFTVPIGEWAEQVVRWVDTDMESKIGFDLLGAIEWPFKFLFSTFVRSGDHHPWWEITDMPWWGVCLLFFFIGSAFRNVKIGIFAATALALCGMLGIEYWDQVSVTLGMIIVAVLLCGLIGVPLGVLCGRVDGVWTAVRPVLDAMQVIHSFVYMLPFIFFFGIGPESSTMVTMIFAIPPLIRLTNLGIRQVPEDVVEASRAYGAPEWRVLLDVQLPLARPAIMTGLNQTLLLSISMLGIAAIMGAGGLGQLVFRAVQNLDVALAASAGLALFAVAVVLDRISQTQATDGMNLFARINRAIVARRSPEQLLAEEEQAASTGANSDSAGRFAPVTSTESTGALIAAGGALVTLVATLFLTWAEGGSLIGGRARRADLDIAADATFGGFAGEGGSWFAILPFIGAMIILASVATLMFRPGEVGRFLGADGAAFSGGVMVAAPLTYIWMSESDLVTTYSDGIGAWVALAGGVIALAGALMWLFDTPYTARTPLKAKPNSARVVIAGFCLLWAVLSGFAAWTFDQRQDTVITPEIQAQLDDVIERSRLPADDPDNIPAAEAAAQIASINAAAQQDEAIYDNYVSEGPQLGYLAIALAAIGLLASVPAAGYMGLDEQFRWRWSVVVAAIGVGMMTLSAALIISILRVADANFVAGAGTFLYFVSGAFLTVTSRAVMAEFRRSRVFAGDSEEIDLTGATADEPEEALTPA
ncbi:MAG: ABC transporter permease subunit [Actinomycetota bacterium]